MRSRFLDEKEINALRRAGSFDWLPFAVAIQTGLRIGDVIKARWEDLDGDTLHFRAQKTGKKGEARLTWQTVAALRRRRKGSSVWLFPSPRDPDKHITRQALWYRIKRTARKARVPLDGVRPHSLRKVYAVREYHAHGLGAVSAALQHENMETTELYALSDWATGENAELPLLRGDIPRICQILESAVMANILRKKGKK